MTKSRKMNKALKALKRIDRIDAYVRIMDYANQSDYYEEISTEVANHHPSYFIDNCFDRNDPSSNRTMPLYEEFI
jgi:hypothetical protein